MNILSSLIDRLDSSRSSSPSPSNQPQAKRPDPTPDDADPEGESQPPQAFNLQQPSTEKARVTSNPLSSPGSWNPIRTKVQTRLAIERLRMLQSKLSALSKHQRREIAELLRQGKVETARVRTEVVIGSDIHVELLELLELYCELLLARFTLLEYRDPDPGILEALSSIIVAAPRTEVKELHTLRDHLTHKYGRDFTLSCPTLSPARITTKLSPPTPTPELVDAYLATIAEGYDVPYEPAYPPPSPPPPTEREAEEGERELEPPLEAEAGEGPAKPPVARVQTARSVLSAAEAKAAGSPTVPAPPETAAKKLGGTVAPGAAGGGAGGAGAGAGTGGKTAGEKERETDAFDALQKRFEALKRPR